MKRQFVCYLRKVLDVTDIDASKHPLGKIEEVSIIDMDDEAMYLNDEDDEWLWQSAMEFYENSKAYKRNDGFYRIYVIDENMEENNWYEV